MEVLSEHLCQGWLEGYLLTGRHGLLSSYEAFTCLKEGTSYDKENPQLDLGLHLTLTSEWKHYRWRPVAALDKVKGLLDAEGVQRAREDRADLGEPNALLAPVRALGRLLLAPVHVFADPLFAAIAGMIENPDEAAFQRADRAEGPRGAV